MSFFPRFIALLALQTARSGAPSEFARHNGVTSAFVRAPRARDLAAHEIPHCQYTFTPAAYPRDDFFKGFACAAQTHLTLASPTSAFVSFVTPEADTPSEVRFGRAGEPLDAVVQGEKRSYTTLITIADTLWAPAMGNRTVTEKEAAAVANTTSWAAPGSASRASELTEGLQQYLNPGAIYSSPVTHTVLLEGLRPGASYAYATSASDEVFEFRVPENEFPLLLGLTADLGQTVVSNRSIARLEALRPDAVLLSGDLSYADGWPFRWDSFGALSSRLFARVPVLVTGGNHEIGASEQWQAFEARWPTPHRSSKSTSPLYWSVDVGPAHVVALNTYDNFLNGGDRLQRKWLEGDLAKVDRAKTPWLIAMMHAPFYNSNEVHRLEAELMRQAYEPLFLKHGVDVVLSGHVHAYERSVRTYDLAPEPCGPAYLNLGDGGNRENTYPAWLQPQPAWSAFRESSFGVGRLELLNATHAKYAWHRDACGTPGEGVGYNLSASCATPLDTGGNPHAIIDEHVFARTSEDASCEALRRDPPALFRKPAASKRTAPPPQKACGRCEEERYTFELSILAAVLGTVSSFAMGALIAVVGGRASSGKCRRGYAKLEGAALITPAKKSPDSVIADELGVQMI